MEKYIIALQQLGIKNEVILQLVTQYSSAEIELIFKDTTNNIFLTDIQFASQSAIFENTEKMDIALKSANEILEKNKELDIKVSIYGDKNYPSNFYNIKNPPVLIYYKGADIGKKCEKAIACVGTRKPTRLSYNIINYLIPQLVDEGYSIISGLALGSDRLAHISTLMCGGNTIAVLAHGLDQISPKKNQRLANDILANGGTLISEYPVGVKPENFRYINRNRLIVGLAKGVIVGECAIKSGTMHSVEFSKEENIPIFCTNPGPIVGEEQEGIKSLLEEKVAIEIKSGRRYYVIIENTGYKVTKENLAALYLKKAYIKSLLYNLWDNEKLYNEILKKFNIEVSKEASKLYINISTENVENLLNNLLTVCIENKISD